MATCIVLSLLFSPATLRAATETDDGRGGTVAGVEQQPTKRTITGIVITGDNNEPAIGATVYLRNSTTGVITDANGRYSITVEGLGGVLEFSYIGYKTQEVALVGQTNIDVTL